MAKLAEEDVFEVEDLRVLRTVIGLEGFFTKVTCHKITAALDTLPKGAFAWKRGVKKVQELSAKVPMGFNLLRPFPSWKRLVGAGSATSYKHATVYKLDGSVAAVLTGHSSEVFCVAVDNSQIMTGCNDGMIFLFGAENFETRGRIQHGKDAVWALAIRGDVAVSGSIDKTVKLWNVAHEEMLLFFQGPPKCESTTSLEDHTAAVRCVDISDEAVVSASDDCTARIWPREGGKCRFVLTHPRNVYAAHLEGDTLATGCGDRIVRTFTVSKGQLTRELRGHRGFVFSVALCGTVLVSGSGDRKVKVWSLEEETTGECVATLEGHVGAVSGVALSPEAGIVASLGGDDKFVLWEPDSGVKPTLW